MNGPLVFFAFVLSVLIAAVVWGVPGMLVAEGLWLLAGLCAGKGGRG